MALTRKQRERLRMKFGGRCAYCGCELPEKGWHADHVQAVLRKSERCMKAAEKGIFRLKSTGDVFRPEADCPENIFPSCAPCNLLKTTYSLEMFRKQVSCRLSGGAGAALTSGQQSVLG